jgi:hypothetical protein
MDVYKHTVKTIFPHRDAYNERKKETNNVHKKETNNVHKKETKRILKPVTIPQIVFFSEDYDKDKFERFCKTVAEEKHEPPLDDTELFKFLLEHLDRIDEVAHDVGILDNNSYLSTHILYHKVIKFQTKLNGLFNPNPTKSKSNRGNLLMAKTGLNIFMITGLEQDIECGGAKIHLTASELLPVSNIATGCMSLYTHASDKLVTCYSVDNNITKLLEKASLDHPLSVGRFFFKSGMCHALSTLSTLSILSTKENVTKDICSMLSNQSIDDHLSTYDEDVTSFDV